MKVVLALLFFGATALAGQPSEHEQNKPAIIQDGAAAQSYTSSALYEYLDKPPYLVITAETPFCSKPVDGKNIWIALVEFYCGVNEQNRLHCMTVIAYDPLTNTHRFMNPDDFIKTSDDDAI
jgi:hypothetical protein